MLEWMPVAPFCLRSDALGPAPLITGVRPCADVCYMETTTKTYRCPPRALASIMFACCSLWFLLVSAADSRAGLQNLEYVTKSVWFSEKLAHHQAILAHDLALGYCGLAVAALTWGMMSWRKERGFAAGIAVLLAALVAAVNLLSFL